MMLYNMPGIVKQTDQVSPFARRLCVLALFLEVKEKGISSSILNCHIGCQLMRGNMGRDYGDCGNCARMQFGANIMTTNRAWLQ